MTALARGEALRTALHVGSAAFLAYCWFVAGGALLDQYARHASRAHVQEASR